MGEPYKRLNDKSDDYNYYGPKKRTREVGLVLSKEMFI